MTPDEDMYSARVLAISATHPRCAVFDSGTPPHHLSNSDTVALHLLFLEHAHCV